MLEMRNIRAHSYNAGSRKAIGVLYWGWVKSIKQYIKRIGLISHIFLLSQGSGWWVECVMINNVNMKLAIIKHCFGFETA